MGKCLVVVVRNHRGRFDQLWFVSKSISVLINQIKDCEC
jgi:hypothetical protein